MRQGCHACTGVCVTTGLSDGPFGAKIAQVPIRILPLPAREQRTCESAQVLLQKRLIRAEKRGFAKAARLV
jgi:hypothetical protein